MTAPVMVWLVNAAWLSDATTTTPPNTATTKHRTSRHLPTVVTAPPVPFPFARAASGRLRVCGSARCGGLHRLDEAVGEPLVHLVEGAVDARDERRQPVGVLRFETSQRGVHLGCVRSLAAGRLGHHVAADRQRDPHLHLGELVVGVAGLL